MHVLITRNNSNSEAVDAALMISAFLNSQDIAYTSVDSYDIDGFDARDFDMAVVLGGDGTVLRTAHLIASSGVPILGINYGHLGFLANPSESGVIDTLAAALAGDVVREQRTNLRIDVLCEGDDEDAFEAACNEPQDLEGGRSFFALNEMNVSRGPAGRIVDFSLNISGAHITDMRGDGLIVASATGSTAYALSAGGPLVAPGFSGLLTVPVASHTLRARPIATDPNDVVEVTLGQTAACAEAMLYVDGCAVALDAPMRSVRVRRGAAPTVLLRYRPEGFYAHTAKVFF